MIFASNSTRARVTANQASQEKPENKVWFVRVPYPQIPVFVKEKKKKNNKNKEYNSRV